MGPLIDRGRRLIAVVESLYNRFGSSSAAFPIILFAFIIAYSTVYLKILHNWWFEDDPVLFSYVRSVPHPLKIFTDRTIPAGFANGKSFVPMQILSYWADLRLGGVRPLFAYYHSLVSLVAAALLLYNVLVRLTKQRLASFCITLTWLFLPSTIAVAEYLTTRHYLEGFGFALLAIYCSHAALTGSKDYKHVFFTLSVFSAFVAMLYKEVYLVLPVFLAAFALYRRRYRLLIAPVGISVAYFAYRVWALGLHVDYPVPFLNPAHYLRFLIGLPYAFSANVGGYAIYLCILLLYLHLLRERKVSLPIFVAFFSSFLMSLAIVYPVSFAVFYSRQSPGPWYRAVFVMNSIVLCFGCHALLKYPKKPARIGIMIAAVAIILLGGGRANRHWRDLMLSAKTEGTFYVNNPGKLLYSEQEASWFIPGVHNLYRIRNKHYIAKGDPNYWHARRMLHTFPTVWRYDKGEIVQDDSLYAGLLRSSDLMVGGNGNPENPL